MGMMPDSNDICGNGKYVEILFAVIVEPVNFLRPSRYRSLLIQYQADIAAVGVRNLVNLKAKLAD